MVDFGDLIEALPVWSMILGGQLLLIVIPASAVFLVLYRWKGNPFQGRKIQPGTVRPATVRREVRYSILTAMVFALNGFGIFVLMSQGWTLVYPEVSDLGWLYSVFSLIIAIILHDAYFYWTHRLMHHRLLFNVFHRLHHESHSPSPWAAYAFTPLEAVVQTMFLTLLIFVLPLHVCVIYLFMVHMIVRNVIGHSGFELFPRGIAAHRVFGILTTNTHHDLHHSAKAGNYGLYFTWWDRICGTENPDYRQTFARVTAAPQSGSAREEKNPLVPLKG